MNAVAGGGSFVAFPTLLFTGVPPISANATNTLSLWVGTAVSGGAYRRHLSLPRRVLLPLVSMGLLGGLAGALLLIKTPAHTFLRLIPWLMLAATLLFTFGRHLTGRLSAGIRNFRFNQSILEMLANVDMLSPTVRAAGEESFEMVVPAMKVRNFHFTEVTKF